MKKETVVFFHIPKTAGTTINSILRPRYSTEEKYICGSDNRTHYQSNVDFIKLDDEQKIKYKYISGHVELFLLQNIPQKHISLTFLRNPIERTISIYYFILNTKTHHLHITLKESKMSLKEFMLSGLWTEADNGITRRISGIRDYVPYGKCDNDILKVAKNNLLGYFDFIGLQERFDESLFLMSKILNLKNILYTSKNVGHNNRKYNHVGKDTIMTIRKYNMYDIELYNFARLEYKKYAAMIKNNFKEDFEKFKNINEKFKKIQKTATNCT